MTRLSSLLHLLLPALCLLLSACGDSPAASQIRPSTPDRFAQFYPDKNILPWPNNLLFAGSEDGTLNQQYDADSAVADMIEPLNTLDGFSVIAPLSATFNVDVDPATLVGGQTVRVFEVTTDGVGGAVTQVVRELDPAEYWVRPDVGEPVGLSIVPTRPLQPKTSYMVVLTRGILAVDGEPMQASTVYDLARSGERLIDDQQRSRVQRVTDAEAQRLETLRQYIRPSQQAVIAFDSSLRHDDIILSWSFTTQSVNDVLLAVRAAADAEPPAATELSLFFRPTPKGFADVYSGTITLPNYMAPPTEAEPGAPLRGFWKGEGGRLLTQYLPMPAVTETRPIPLLVTIPRGPKPANGWPVIIFQHGNTSNRAALIAMADNMALSGFAAVAIDLPMHGITGDETNGSEMLRQPGRERIYDLDLLKNGTDLPEPDGIKDPSGSYFIKLNQVLTTRDNIRQGVADLLRLRRALPAMDYDGGGPDFDTRRVYFIGHSLGATVGAVYMGVENQVGASSLGMPGGAIAKQLDGSPTSGPSIALGMAANGIHKGTQDYERFLAAVQMVLDAADPLNYAPTAAAQRPMLLLEVVGSATSLPDQIVPNHVLDAPGTVPSPTGGTDPLWRAMGLQIHSQTTSGSQLRAVVRFNAGHHSSLISSFDAEGNEDPLSERVMDEMQRQILSFFASDGNELLISEPDLVEPD